MNTANIIIGLHDGEDDAPYHQGRPPAVHHAIVLGVEESMRYFPVCGVNPHEGWTAEGTEAPVDCKRCLAWLAKKPPRISAHQPLFEALVTALVGSVRPATLQAEGWTCTGCDAPLLREDRGEVGGHKPECPWPMLYELLELE